MTDAQFIEITEAAAHVASGAGLSGDQLIPYDEVIRLCALARKGCNESTYAEECRAMLVRASETLHAIQTRLTWPNATEAASYQADLIDMLLAKAPTSSPEIGRLLTDERVAAMAKDLSVPQHMGDFEVRTESAVGTLDWALRQGDVLADWCNVSGAALAALMDAYERRIRSLCTPEQINTAPWRCAEFIAAERALASKPVATVVLSQDTGTDAEAIKAFKDRFPPPPNPQAPTMKEGDRG